LVCAAGFQPRLLQFVDSIARLRYEGELNEAGESYEPVSEDAIATLNELILKARQLLGIAEKCDACGETVAYIIVCPDGAELCQNCFDGGKH